MISFDDRLKQFTIGSPRWFHAQKEIIWEKPLLKKCYDEWYRQQIEDLAKVPATESGGLLELGSGGSYLKTLLPELVTSDVEEGIADCVIDARSLPCEDGSVRAIFLSHVFHHIPDVEKFLREADRVLVNGGVVSMIEVAHTPMARFVFKSFHHEPYDDGAKNWQFAQTHAMNHANQALSWIVFQRDRATFEGKFPRLKIERVNYLPWFSYLVSGGVTRKPFLPSFLDGFCELIDRLTQPLLGLFSLHWKITLRKVG